ncbi:hypothetical protein EDC04DRAFT_1197819 [Pisolithus marmoratus]|nr:hypothetical protein EDC04DRAFT_1197819 [Pisolithus marmoratus]
MSSICVCPYSSEPTHTSLHTSTKPKAHSNLSQSAAQSPMRLLLPPVHLRYLRALREVTGRGQSGKDPCRKETDHRAELFSLAMKMASEMGRTNRKLPLRMRLQQANLAVKDPKTTRREHDRGLETALGNNLV